MNRTLIVSIFIFFNAVFVFSQQTDSLRIKMLEDKITANLQFATVNPEKAFLQTEYLMEQVKREGYKEGELILLARQCFYFINKDLKKAINANQKLRTKAEEYGSAYYQAAVHEIFSIIYVRSDLGDKALEECEAAIKLFDQVNDKSKMQDVVIHKVNVYTIANEVYTGKKKSKEAVKMLLKANNEIKKLKKSEKKRFILRANYTNLAGSYIAFNIDSAEYYVNQSVLLLKNDGKSDIVQFNNNLHLGKIYKQRKDYVKAIISYKKAEGQLSYINSTLESTNLIYTDLAEIYKKTDSLEPGKSLFAKTTI
ncbi:MAG: hypothetical protein M0D53_01265 [Flavobacterium sp. JAD_PAG50586_2]|nr:MAG: hypothetical protein M0D53_01265 [Flavobacterium sp. JAD_PAG50586_2]